jgi:hypothetical protein
MTTEQAAADIATIDHILEHANPVPLFSVGQVVTAVAFTDCFNEYHESTPGLVVESLRLILPSDPIGSAQLQPYWRVKAVNPENPNLYHEGAERFFTAAEYDPTCVLCEFGEEPGHEH